jgi:hypothetical protein
MAPYRRPANPGNGGTASPRPRRRWHLVGQDQLVLHRLNAADAGRFFKELGKVLNKRPLMMTKCTLRRSIRRPFALGPLQVSLLVPLGDALRARAMLSSIAAKSASREAMTVRVSGSMSVSRAACTSGTSPV